jgi:hypothetical protein
MHTHFEESESLSASRLILDRLRYVTLPGRCPRDFAAVDLHNHIYRYWETFWNQIFSEISPGEVVAQEDFFRQNVVSVLLDADKIVSVHLYSFFNLKSEAALAQPYFKKNYFQSDISQMLKRDVHTVMSMEYLTLDPKYRKSVVGFSMSELIIGLGFEVLKSSGQEAMIAPCRRDLKVDRMAEKFGAIPLGEEHIHHGVPVVNVITPLSLLRPHGDPFIAGAVEKIWAGRTSHLDQRNETFVQPNAA